MKAKAFVIASVFAAALQLAPLTFAQSPDGDEFEPRRRHARFLAGLSADERAKLRAAHHQAMADPAVQAAKDRHRQAAREFRDLKRQRMLQADPSIQPILDKLPARGPKNR